MKTRVAIITLGIFLLWISLSYSGPLDWLKGQLNTVSTTTKMSDTKVGSGLKEALRVGIENTIKILGKKDGYLANQAVKILLPGTIQKAEPVLRDMGLGAHLDEFTLSMNRAAEKAAPVAADIFSSAIAEISFDDVQAILKGGNTAATDYLKSRTSSQLLEQFKPVVRGAMDQYAVTKKFNMIVSKAQSVPFIANFARNIDLNEYVSSRALEGLFNVLAQQEAKIRADPAARVTDLLKEVFK